MWGRRTADAVALGAQGGLYGLPQELGFVALCPPRPSGHWDSSSGPGQRASSTSTTSLANYWHHVAILGVVNVFQGCEAMGTGRSYAEHSFLSPLTLPHCLASAEHCRSTVACFSAGSRRRRRCKMRVFIPLKTNVLVVRLHRESIFFLGSLDSLVLSALSFGIAVPILDGNVLSRKGQETVQSSLDRLMTDVGLWLNIDGVLPDIEMPIRKTQTPRAPATAFHWSEQ